MTYENEFMHRINIFVFSEEVGFLQKVVRAKYRSNNGVGWKYLIQLVYNIGGAKYFLWAEIIWVVSLGRIIWHC